jgi:Na+/melibiose symporter-like transporter
MLCLAPSGLSAHAYVWYFGLFYFLYYSVGWSMTVITYDALAMELTTDYDERSSLFGYKGMSQMIGYILYFAAAGVFAATYPNDVHQQIFIPGILFCVAVLLAFGQMLVVVDEPPQSEAQIKAAGEENDGIVPMVRRMLRNPVYWSYLWFKAPGSMGK